MVLEVQFGGGYENTVMKILLGYENQEVTS